MRIHPVDRYLDQIDNYGPEGVAETVLEDLELNAAERREVMVYLNNRGTWQKYYATVNKGHKVGHRGRWAEHVPGEPEAVLCKGCGLEIPERLLNHGRGRPRLYHDETCRKRWQREQAKKKRSQLLAERYAK